MPVVDLNASYAEGWASQEEGTLMGLIQIILFSAFFLAGSSNEAHLARKLLDRWTTCENPIAVIPAADAFARGDYKEIGRLGCRFSTPDTVRARALHCEPSALDFEPAWFSYAIERDLTLPKGICEIEVTLPDGWNAILYTHFRNIEKSN